MSKLKGKNLAKKIKHAGFQVLLVFLLAALLFSGCPQSQSGDQPQDGGQEETSALQVPAPSVIRGDGELSIGWPAEAGIAYQVLYGTTNNSVAADQWNGTISGSVAGTTITGLSNGTTYYVWIRAQDAEETKESSQAAAGTPEAPPSGIQGFVYVSGGTVAGNEAYAMTVTVPTNPSGYYGAGKTFNKKGIFVEGRTVELDSFFMAKYETTRQLWYEVQTWAKASNYSFQNETSEPAEDDKNKPVSGISWRDAIVWCNAYSEKSSLQPVYYSDGSALKDSQNTGCDSAVMDKSKNGFRLPTEAEREFAARGGDPGKADWMFLFAGSNNADDVAWHHGNSQFTVNNVGVKNPNRLGIHDLSGNVQEWGWDWMNYSVDVTPQTPPDGWPYSSLFSQKPMAGGGVGSNITYSCVADRWGYATNYTNLYVGFRLVRKVE